MKNMVTLSLRAKIYKSLIIFINIWNDPTPRKIEVNSCSKCKHCFQFILIQRNMICTCDHRMFDTASCFTRTCLSLWAFPISSRWDCWNSLAGSGVDSVLPLPIPPTPLDRLHPAAPETLGQLLPLSSARRPCPVLFSTPSTRPSTIPDSLQSESHQGNWLLWQKRCHGRNTTEPRPVHRVFTIPRI